MSVRKEMHLMQEWGFENPTGKIVMVDLPHTWNALDGQDGGNDYFRGQLKYSKQFIAPTFSEDEDVYIVFEGVNASAKVMLNEVCVGEHHGGYATFRYNITPYLKESNLLEVIVDNSVNDKVYPQKADFTFYGGIYRAVQLLVVNKAHFDLDYYGGNGVKVTPKVSGTDGVVCFETFHNAPDATVKTVVRDHLDQVVATAYGQEATIKIPQVHLWNGIKDPYLYQATVQLLVGDRVVDEVATHFGVRSFHVDPQKGFFLNGKPYSLHGVSRHQDRKGIGNALTREHHDEDMALIKEIGATTVRLAHYQHDQYFYDLCDRNGLVVWAEIPYISEHMPNGLENTISQMKELIVQNYHHPSIVTWGISNEITISTKDNKHMLENHHILNDLCHKMDPTRVTSLACYAVCGPMNPVAHISDVVSWNLYLGWYVPGLFLNDWWINFFHWKYPNRALGFAEYGCEGMPNLHSKRPRRGDHSEEYQAKYHEFMLKCFKRHPYMWANHVWNMFDFAADARDQGGEPGMNHKGLVTFDRKVKKDSFYLYKAYWSEEPFVHIASKRFEKRTGKKTKVKVYSNCGEIALYCNGQLVEKKKGDKVFTFTLPLEQTMQLEAKAGSLKDTATIYKVNKPEESYKLKKNSTSANWV